MSADSDSLGEEGDDLRTRLHAMEAKLKRMRDQRAGHNDSARAYADQRNTIQEQYKDCLLYTSPSPRDRTRSRMPSSA